MLAVAGRCVRMFRERSSRHNPGDLRQCPGSHILFKCLDQEAPFGCRSIFSRGAFNNPTPLLILPGLLGKPPKSGKPCQSVVSEIVVFLINLPGHASFLKLFGVSRPLKGLKFRIVVAHIGRDVPVIDVLDRLLAIMSDA